MKNTIPIEKRLRGSGDIEGDALHRVKDWVTFYRNNIHRFVEHYMEIKLFPYQKVWIYLISKSTKFFGYASRASAKSWLISVYATARCILFPGTGIVLASSTKKQAGLIIEEKIETLKNNYPNIRREIRKITTNQNKYEVEFYNGSKIFAVVSRESGRGNRANIIVLEERRLIDASAIQEIIRPFLVSSRDAPYMKIKEYAENAGALEEPQEIIISSVYYKSGEWYAELVKGLVAIANGSIDVKAIFFDYLISLKHNIKTRKQMAQALEDDDPIGFNQEYGNIPYGGSTRSFYNISFFNRDVKKAWLPARDDVSFGKNKYAFDRSNGEIRIVAVDVATAAGRFNDNTIIVCARLFPTMKGYRVDISYMESFNGENSVTQAKRIKEIYHQFSGYAPEDILVLDILNAGRSIYDIMTQVTYDERRDVEYPALKVMEHEDISDSLFDDLDNRSLVEDAHPCIFPIAATSELNGKIAYAFRDRMKNGLLRFIVDDARMEEILISRKNKDIISHTDSSLRPYLLAPSVQTTLLINESVSLEATFTGGGETLRLDTPSGGRKDRYSAASYLNWVVTILDRELLKQDSTKDIFEELEGAFFMS